MKKGATKRLIREMLLNKACAKYIECGWYSLYLDIITYAGNEKVLESLDGISVYALLDWYELQSEI